MNPITKIISSVLGNSNFTNLFKGKETKKNEFLMEIANKLHEANSKQIEVNKVEASSIHLYVAGWRPTVGYVCAIALAYQFFIRSIINYLILIFNPEFPIPPQIDITQLISILVAMLGMGALRTYDKKNSK